jgi:hypothetical protein
VLSFFRPSTFVTELFVSAAGRALLCVSVGVAKFFQANVVNPPEDITLLAITTTPPMHIGHIDTSRLSELRSRHSDY